MENINCDYVKEVYKDTSSGYGMSTVMNCLECHPASNKKAPPAVSKGRRHWSNTMTLCHTVNTKNPHSSFGYEARKKDIPKPVFKTPYMIRITFTHVSDTSFTSLAESYAIAVVPSQ